MQHPSTAARLLARDAHLGPGESREGRLVGLGAQEVHEAPDRRGVADGCVRASGTPDPAAVRVSRRATRDAFELSDVTSTTNLVLLTSSRNECFSTAGWWW